MYDPNTPVGLLGLSPAEARKERQRRSAQARQRALDNPPPYEPSLEDRVAFLELLVAELQATLNEHNHD